MGKKEQLANQYINLKREFDGPDFKENILAHQVSFLVKNFKIVDLEEKCEAVKLAIIAKNARANTKLMEISRNIDEINDKLKHPKM